MKPFDQLLDRVNGLGADGWTAVADALEGVTSLTSLNGCIVRPIIEGGLKEIQLQRGLELGVCVVSTRAPR